MHASAFTCRSRGADAVVLLQYLLGRREGWVGGRWESGSDVGAGGRDDGDGRDGVREGATAWLVCVEFGVGGGGLVAVGGDGRKRR